MDKIVVNGASQVRGVMHRRYSGATNHVVVMSNFLETVWFTLWKIALLFGNLLYFLTIIYVVYAQIVYTSFPNILFINHCLLLRKLDYLDSHNQTLFYNIRQ